MAQPYTLTPRTSSGAPAMPSSEEVQQLQQQIAQMQQQMNALLQGGAPQAQQAPKASTPRPTRVAFKPNMTAIQNLDGSNPRRLVEGALVVERLTQLLEPARTSAVEPINGECSRAKWIRPRICVRPPM